MFGLTGITAQVVLPFSPASSAYIGPSRARVMRAMMPSGVTLDLWRQPGHCVGVPATLTYASC